MRKKILKTMIATICVIALILPTSSTVLAKITSTAKGTEQTFGISKLHSSSYLNGEGTKEFGYRVNSRNAYRIYSGDTASTEGFANTILCLDKDGGFPLETGTSYSTSGTYKSQGEATSELLQTVKTTKSGTKTNLTKEDSEKIIWLMNNAVLPEDSSELRDLKLAKIFADDFEQTATTQNPLTLDYVKRVLTEDDLVFALQATIWTITNPETNPVYQGTADGNRYNSLSGNDVITSKGMQGEFINIIMDYYKSNYTGANIVASSSDGKVNPKITVPSTTLKFTNDDTVEAGKTKGTINGKYMYVGPFKIESSETGKETVEYKVGFEFLTESNTKVSSNNVDYYITDGQTRLAETKESLEGKEFYVAIKQGTSIRTVNIKLDSATIQTTSTPTLWQVENDENMQPLISVERSESEIESIEAPYKFEAEFSRQYDIALRKYITTIYKSGEYGFVPTSYTRNPSVTKETEGTFNQYSYAHQKDPVTVEVGDIVKYDISVYNECDYQVRIQKIIDYLPIGGGLEFLEPGTTTTDSFPVPAASGYSVMKIEGTNGGDDKIVISSPTNQEYIKNTIPAAQEGQLSSITVSLYFRVTEEATGRVVTNIAEVAEFTGENDTDGDGNGDGTFIQQQDIDSEVYNIDLPTSDEEWQDYIGNDTAAPNKSDLTDSNYYYKGQEDDDDFEKIEVVDETKLDFALRKSITAVNGTAQDRQKDPDTTPLNNGTSTTSIFTDDKTPLVLKVGDKVTYTIRVFNEGNSDGYATEISDYIPEGLGFLPNYTDNINNGWNIDENNAGTTAKLVEITNGTDSAVNNFTASDFTENGITDYQNQTVVKGTARLTTTKLANTILTNYNDTKTLDIKTVQVTCVVLPEAEPATSTETKYIRNVAAITGYADKNKNTITYDKTDSYSNNDLSSFNESSHEDDEDYEKFRLIKPEEPEEPDEFPDLALKKYISSLTDATNNTKTIKTEQKRNLTVTNVDALKNRTKTAPIADATYSFGVDKATNAVDVAIGDNVTYTIRIYNEGNVEATALEIRDTVPEGLTFLPDSSTNKKYGWSIDTSASQGTETTVTSTYGTGKTLQAFDENRANGFDEATGLGSDSGINYLELKIEFKVNEKAKASQELENIAEITKDDIDDNDSTPNNNKPEEDDQDFDVVTPIEYDLALKKYVSSLSDSTNTVKVIPEEQRRNLKITDVTKLEQRKNSSEPADAEYSFGVEKNQIPVDVEIGDYVTYTIRVFNEGQIDAYLAELRDTVPEGLTFLPDSSTNKKYGWSIDKEKTTEKTTTVKTSYITDKKLNAFNSQATDNYDETTGTGIEKGVSFIELKIEFKVNENATASQKLRNIAEITKDDGDDDDSTPDNDDPDEDDQDYDDIIPGKFDLSLRKFITRIEDTEIEERIPVVDTSKLDNGTSTTATYTHPKQEDIKIVVKGQTVVYTIRVYNEGTKNGYVSEIKDDLPDGIQYLPDNQINKDNGWVMYDKDGNETTNVKDAVEIRTRIKSKENGEENLLHAYDKDTMKDGPEYVDVQVAFIVTKESVTDGQSEIINTAEITEETDENGNKVKDDDSTPDNNKEDEDDIDKEYIQLKYFDLSLLKYVTKVIVTEDGVTKETVTGYNGTENPEPIVKVELNKNKLSKTEVKYIYTIKITNEGEIEGYATEIKDRIPEGLAFYAEDNTEYRWQVQEDGIITTDYLKDTLLKPGESAEVQVTLRWVNSESNMGQKVNVAEISKDKNEYNVPDIDSTPDNNKDGEDDQDNAIVVLSIKTGSAPLYITLIIAIAAILGSGIYVIKKYVINK